MVQREAQKRAKSKYYAKLRENEEYRANMAQRSRDYYQRPENKENHNKTLTKTVRLIKQILINISRRRERVIY